MYILILRWPHKHATSISRNNVAVLTSFVGREDDSGVDMRPRRFYGVIRLSVANEPFMVQSVHPVPYQTVCCLPSVIGMIL